MTWTIVLPAWGDRALDYFSTTSLPSVEAALIHAGITDARFIVHTDQERRVRKLVGVPCLTLAPAPNCVSKYHALGFCHHDAITRADPGTKIAIINADHAVSVELFTAADRRFDAGKMLIMAAGTRTLSKERPPVGARARDLLRWAWTHRHPVITDAIWGTGHSPSLSVIHFVEGDEVIARAFHLHPVAFVRRAGLKFAGITIDDGLVDAFTRDEIHVVTDADELALAECSPADYGFASRETTISLSAIARWAGKLKGPRHPRASAAHRWLFTHRISIKGTGKEIGDTAVCNAVLGMLDNE